ncbi:DNA polymerase III subunit gamma/tau [Alteromonas facilis]|uniref:DNA polymerase III subunit gamma/tau n=1 Tax=Alteromonas facilis TaxID=2048004 RepID=UPI000C28A7BA|nr:DNA polymerase III subunit gamma/tau [Alteromonas facilis]
MGYQVLARKWRPQVFSQLVGQEHVVSAISNALDNNRLHHAYLFTGTRGVGKTTIARIFAKSLNCEQGQGANPCGKCNTCQDIEQGRFVDLLEIDAASRTKVEDTRELLDNVQYRPTRGDYKVYLIDEVHMLSKHSFNALLKTLEEPPPHVKFLLATTDPQKLPITILSRCLQFNLKALSREQITQQLEHVLSQESIAFESPALNLIARAAQGSMRDALSLTDQAIAQGNNSVTQQTVVSMLGLLDRNQVLRLAQSLAGNDANAVMTLVEELSQQAPDFAQVLSELNATLHQVALTQLVPDACRLDTNHAKVIYQLAKSFTPEHVQLLYQIGVDGLKSLSFAPDPRSGVEMVLLRMLAFSPKASLSSLESIIQEPPQSTENSSHAVQPVSNEQITTSEQSVELPVQPAEPVEQATTSIQQPPPQDDFGDDGHAELLAQQAAIEEQADQYREAETTSSHAPASEDDANLARTKAMLEMQQRMAQSLSSEEQPPTKKSVEPETVEQTQTHADTIAETPAAQTQFTKVEQENELVASVQSQEATETRQAVEPDPQVVHNEASTHDIQPAQAASELDNSVQHSAQSHAPIDDYSAQPVAHVSATEAAKENDLISEGALDAQSAIEPVQSVSDLTPVLPNGSKLVTAAQIDSWAAMIDDMGLGGLVKQVAIHAEYSYVGNTVNLLLDTAQEHLLNEGIVKTLKQTMSNCLGQSVELNITVGEGKQTPFSIQQRIDDMRQVHARQTVDADESIQHLIQTFNGKVLEDSIKPQ